MILSPSPFNYGGGAVFPPPRIDASAPGCVAVDQMVHKGVVVSLLEL